MSSLSGALNAPAALYRYDAENLLACTGTPANPLWRYWNGDAVTNAVDADKQLSWPHWGSQRIAALRSGTGATATLLGADQAGSILVEAETDVRHQCYSPYGYLPSETADPRLAYNGELLDQASGCYLLGAGHHRPYSPTLHYFLAPDALSPFYEGGVNSYAYCAGDPINRMDPTGHIWKWIVMGISAVAAVVSLGALAAPLVAGSAALTASAIAGAAMSAVSAVTEVGALIAEATGNELASGIFGAVGLMVGIVGIGTALPSIAKAGGQLVKRLGKFARSRKLTTSDPSGGWHTGGYLKLRDGSPPSRRPSFEGEEYISHMPRRHTATSSPAASPRVPSSLNPLLYKDLGAEAKTVLEQVRTGVPTRFPEFDGAVYRNKNGFLPPSTKGNRYVEYSVPNPNQAARGTHRLVLDTPTPAGPKTVYFSGDHYTTFKRVIFSDPLDNWYPRPS